MASTEEHAPIHTNRKEIARYLLSRGRQAFDDTPDPSQGEVAEVMAADEAAAPLRTLPKLTFPDGLAPTPQPLAGDPDPKTFDPATPVPKADVVVITWTVDEWRAMADVLTPGVSRAKWYPYSRNFDAYAPKIRPGAPAANSKLLGRWFQTTVGTLRVVCFKSELHLNQDGIQDKDANGQGLGTSTLPVKELFQQLVEDCAPTHMLTIGTSGSVRADFQLGDVAIARAARFRLQDEFRNEPFNGVTYTSDWTIPTAHLDEANALMATFGGELTEPPFGPPTTAYHYDGPLIDTDANVPDIKLDPELDGVLLPILTTDYFEYGTSTNGLDQIGCAVEMGDAALGLAMSELPNPPKWAAIRNMSDPQINGTLPGKGAYPLNEQTTWAVGYYAGYGYYTSVTGALATWGVLAGLAT